jgi:hypothetical protein
MIAFFTLKTPSIVADVVALIHVARLTLFGRVSGTGATERAAKFF